MTTRCRTNTTRVRRGSNKPYTFPVIITIEDFFFKIEKSITIHGHIMFTDTRPFDNLSADEKEHRIAEVASRLKFIGDKAVERYNTESSSSAVESPQGQGHSGRAGKL